MLNICVAVYLNVLQLRFYSRAVFGCLNGLALHLTQHAVNILQFSLWTKEKTKTWTTDKDTPSLNTELLIPGLL